MQITMFYTAEGKVVMELEGQALEMNRPEAEELFVELGRTLQDMDLVKYAHENMEGDQPDG